MERSKEVVRIRLTPAQREMILKITGRQAEALELTVEELEERIAPMKITRPA